MALTTYCGEKSVGEIADKLYSRLTPKQREKAEAALLKANSQLRKIKTLPKGSILRVPNLPELRAKFRRRRENPHEQIADTLADALDEYGKRLTEHFQTEQDAMETQSALLGSAAFKAALSNTPDLKELAGRATETLQNRAQTVKKRQEAAEKAIKQARADLDKIDT